MSKSLYDTDFSSWTQTQAEALRAKDWAALDVEPLAEEIEDLGISIQHAIESHLERLLLHLLKLRYDPATRPRRVWRLTVVQARHEIAKLARRPTAPSGDLPAGSLSACPALRRRGHGSAAGGLP
jgi:hypothetical protein